MAPSFYVFVYAYRDPGWIWSNTDKLRCHLCPCLSEDNSELFSGVAYPNLEHCRMGLCCLSEGAFPTLCCSCLLIFIMEFPLHRFIAALLCGPRQAIPSPFFACLSVICLRIPYIDDLFHLFCSKPV